MHSSASRSRFITMVALVFACAVAAHAQEFDFSDRSVHVTPSGGDDTHALQGAFDICVAIGPGCTVRLSAGTFLTRQLIVRDFDGRFVGAGMDATILEPFGVLPVNANENVLAEPPSADNPWPFLMLFLNADMTMSDLGFRVTAEVVTTTWHIFALDVNALSTLVIISGDASRVDVERISMESGVGTFFGVNVINGMYFQGVLPGPSGGFGDRPPLSGTFTVRDSRFQGPDASVAVNNVLNATLFVSDNLLDGNLSLLAEDFDGSTIVATGNDIRGAVAGVFAASGSFRNQSRPGRLLLAGNTIRAGPGGYGVQLADRSDPASLEVVISGNRIELDQAAAGVMGVGSIGTVVRGNTLSGSAVAGIQIGEAQEDPAAPAPVASGWAVVGNDLGALSAGTSPVWVTAGAAGTFVTCGAAVLDEGEGTVVACD